MAQSDIDWSKHHDTIVRMLAENYTFPSIAGAIGVHAERVRRYADRAGLRHLKPKRSPPTKKPDRTHMRGAASRPKAKRGGMKAWRPPVTSGDLETAVAKLRTRNHLVCAESTIRYPSAAPKPYTENTLFRVGARQNVTAAQMLEMAGALGNTANLPGLEILNFGQA